MKNIKKREIREAEKEDIKINNKNNERKFIINRYNNNYKNMDLNIIDKNNKNINKENGLNGISYLKDSLSKIISESLSHTENYINKNIKSKLDLMDTRINKLQNKISKLNNNQKGSKKINLESKINSIWLESLEVYLTGPVLHLLNENLAKKVLIRINMINRGRQISDILINLVEESIDKKYNIFKKLEYSEQNDILDSLFNMFNSL